MKKYVCSVCGFVYDEAAGLPDAGIAPGTKWEALPENWVCPICGASKAEFQLQEEKIDKQETSFISPVAEEENQTAEALREMSFAEVSALCSNLARGCRQQYLPEEEALFMQLADYYQAKSKTALDASVSALLAKIEDDLQNQFPTAQETAKKMGDRGALRVLVWSEKVSRILASLLSRYEKEGDGFLENTNVWVCDVCGFVYVGEEPPAICPVCKVPKLKIMKVQRG